MKSRIVVMLTHHDKTVANAIETFRSCSDLPVKYWGFKDIGLEKEKMKELIGDMKKAGKETALEVVTYSESECAASAKLAVELGFDYLMGTIFYPSVWEYLKDVKIKYFPFTGHISGSPSVLEGTVEEIIAQGEKLTEAGVAGFDLLAYRYTGDPEELARRYVSAMKIPVVIAGSINSRERMQFVEDIDAWGFTMGGALFEGVFAQGEGFRENLKAVLALMETIQ